MRGANNTSVLNSPHCSNKLYLVTETAIKISPGTQRLAGRVAHGHRRPQGEEEDVQGAEQADDRAAGTSQTR